MYRIVLTGGSVKKPMYDGLTYEDALAICEDYGWSVQINGVGYEWDMEIEEMD